jgi:hypothetical protein
MATVSNRNWRDVIRLRQARGHVNADVAPDRNR